MQRRESLIARFEMESLPSDCVVVVNGKTTFQANSTALASNSRSFYDTLKVRLTKSNSTRLRLTSKTSDPIKLDLEYADANTIKDMLDFIANISSRKEQLSDDDLLDLLSTDRLKSRLRAAREFAVPRLIDAIVSSALRNLTHSNCWDVLAIAADPDCACDMLELVAKEYILCHFCQVMTQPQFVRYVSYELLCALLRTDYLNAPNEFELFDAICNWVNADLQPRLQYFPRLLSHVRLGRLTAVQMNKICASEIVRRTPQSGALIKWFTVEYAEFRASDQKANIQPMLRAMLSPRQPHQAIFLCGGIRHFIPRKKITLSEAVEVFDPLMNSWTLHDKFSPVLDTRLVHSACVEFDGMVYVIGGASQPTDEIRHSLYSNVTISSRVQTFDLRRGVWCERAPLTLARHFLCGCKCAGGIYAIGGNTEDGATNVVEICTPAVGTWQLGPAMRCRRTEAGVASLNGLVYVCGGRNADVFHATMEQLDPVAGQWTMLAGLPAARTGLSLCPFNSFIFAMGGSCVDDRVYRTVHRYNPSEDTWSEANPMKSSRCQFVSCVLYDCLYAIGGRTKSPDRPGLSFSTYPVERLGPDGVWDPRPPRVKHTESGCCIITGYDLIEPLVPRNRILYGAVES